MIPYLLITLGALSRLLPHPPNFTPITAIAIYGGVRLGSRLGFIIPVGALFLSDLFLGFHKSLPAVYGCFLLIVGLGLLIRNRPGLLRLAGATLAGSLLFYIVTCYVSWRGGGVIGDAFSQNILISLPFFRNMLIGDAFYVTAIFGFDHLARLYAARHPQLQPWLFKGAAM